MPLQPLDFSRYFNAAQPQEAPSPLEQYFKGAGLVQGRDRANAEQQKLALANAIQEKFGMPQAEADLDLSRAAAEKARKEAMFGGNLTGHAKDAQSLYMMEQQLGADHPAVKLAKSLFEMQQKNTESNISNRESVNRHRSFSMLPADDKARMLAGYRALGFDEAAAVEMISNGKTLYDAAKDQGATDEEARNIDREYAPTASIRTQIKETEGAAAEEAYLGKKISDATSKFSKKFFGVSPALIHAGFKSDPKSVDDYAKYMAARALGPEKALLQIRMAGGSTAQQAIHEIMERTGANGRTFDAQMTPEIYNKMQKYIHEWLQEAVKRRVNAMKGQKSNSSQDGSNVSVGITPDGRRVMVPSNKMDEFVSKGGKRG